MATEILYPKVKDAVRAYHKFEAVKVKEAREKYQKPLCTCCLKHDYTKGELKDDVKEYLATIFVSESNILDYKNKTKVIGKMTDYKCKLGHNASYEDIDYEAMKTVERK